MKIFWENDSARQWVGKNNGSVFLELVWRLLAIKRQSR